MNPKANFQNGWTVKAKQTRKRKQTTGAKTKAKKAKKTGSKKSRKKDWFRLMYKNRVDWLEYEKNPSWYFNRIEIKDAAS